jgi:hypothetical protein
MKLSCDIIRDLLPLYAEELASADSAGVVEEHLCECEGCRAQLDALKKPVPVPAEEPGIRKVRKGLVRRWLLGLTCGMLSILLIVSCAGWWLLNPIYLQESVVTSVEPSEHLEGWVEIYASAPQAGYRRLYGEGREWSEGTRYTVFYTCRAAELMQEEPLEEYLSVRPGDGTIWLFQDDGSMVLLHGDGENDQPPVQWSYLEKFTIAALAVGIFLAVLGLSLRKKRLGQCILSAGVLALCYAASQWVVCGGSMASFFWKRELLWAVLIAGCSWGIGMCVCGMRKKA